MKWGRLTAGILLAIALAPGTFVRTKVVFDYSTNMQVASLNAITPEGWPDGLQLDGAWWLQSDNKDFFGFSSLIIEPEGQFLAFNDGGGSALFPKPGETGELVVEPVPYDEKLSRMFDAEAAIIDQESGTKWLAYEHHNAIRRIDEDGTSHVVFPEAMEDWGRNSGPESLARLKDGRFLVLSERDEIGLIFSGDPLESGEPEQFKLPHPGDFRPTDMAMLPDGRALVLWRDLRWQIPPFATMLMVGDPSQIKAGEEWELTPLAQFDNREIRENYEGMAVEQVEDGIVNIWLISDDNRSILQRTLLLKLRWDYSE